LERVLKQPVAVVNRPGAAGATGAHFVANAAPDGYTLLVHLVSISTLPEVDKLFGRPAVFTREQFAGLARLNAEPPLLLVHPSIPSRNLKEFVALARSRPGEMVFTSSGPYGASHVPYEMFLQAAGLKMRHLPFTGGGPAMTAVLGGHAVTWASPPAIASPHIKAGKVKVFANWGAKRLADYPDVPTLMESGYDVEFYQWTAFFAPKNIPPDAFNVLREAARQVALHDPEFKKAKEKLLTPIAYQDADEFRVWWEKDAEKLAAVIRRIGKVAEKP
jgi:tripartite-type tricarboxylate transporter receptor subunit TctC